MRSAKLTSSASCSDFLPNPDSRLTDLYWPESPPPRTSQRNPKAYAVPGPRTFGNARAGIIRGPGMTRFDLSLNKQFRVSERKYFQLRLAAFNATNTPIFQAPASLVITAPTFGQIRSSQSERNVQLVAKLYF